MDIDNRFKYRCEFMRNIGIINLTIEADRQLSDSHRLLYSFPSQLQTTRGILSIVIASQSSLTGVVIGGSGNEESIQFKPFSKDIHLPSKHIMVSVKDARCIAQQDNVVSFNIPFTFIDDEQKLNHQLEREDSVAYTNECQVANIKSLLKEQQGHNEKGLNIYCRTCNSLLTIGIKDTKCLPSSNWTEILDVWLCGCTGVSQFNGLPTQDLQSIPNLALVGDQYLLINNLNINLNSIQSLNKDHINDNNNNNHIHNHQHTINNDNDNNINLNEIIIWKRIECSSCQQDIGSQNQDSFRFYKHTITTKDPLNNNNQQSSNIFAQHSVNTLFSTFMISESQSSTMYKFLLQSSTTHQIFAQITLLGWDSLVNTDNSGLNYKPIIKVLYKIFTKDNPMIGGIESVAFKSRFMTLSDEDCFSILDSLEKSNQSLPIFSQSIYSPTNNSKIGILDQI